MRSYFGSRGRAATTLGILLLAIAVGFHAHVAVALACGVVGLTAVASGVAARRRVRALARVADLVEAIEPAATTAAPRATTSPVTNRLVELESLRRAGPITESELTQERWDILGEV